MHAVRLHAFGPAENLTYERTDDPVPGPGQVRIAVAAAGVHLLDAALREGAAGPYPAPTELPTIAIGIAEKASRLSRIEPKFA